MTNASLDDLALVAETRRRQAEVASEMGQIRTAEVAQLDPPEVVPDAFVRIQIGCVARQLLQMDAPGTPLTRNSLSACPR